jgi:uncharacterized membrane protein
MLSSIGKRIAPWRFLLFFAVLIGACGGGVAFLPWSKGLLAGFDVAALTFIAACLSIFRYDAAKMRRVAKDNDANRGLLLVTSFVLTLVILAAVIAELGQDELTLFDKLLVAVSLVLVWMFANAVYSLHYAHLFYTSDDGGKDSAGLDFPECDEPLMGDFVYFAYTLGVAVQTSDVQVTSPHIRKVVTAHSIIGFFFNLGVLALTINVLASG